MAGRQADRDEFTAAETVQTLGRSDPDVALAIFED